MQGVIKKRKERAKFSGRTHSTRGLVSMVFGIISVIAFLVLVNYTFILKGQASEYVGSIGIFLFMFSVIGLVLGIKGLREEDVYKMSSTIGTTFNSIALLVLIAVFIKGILL